VPLVLHSRSLAFKVSEIVSYLSDQLISLVAQVSPCILSFHLLVCYFFNYFIQNSFELFLKIAAILIISLQFIFLFPNVLNYLFSDGLVIFIF